MAEMIADIAFPLRLSFQVAAWATALTAVVGVALAYVLARYEFPGKNVLDVLVTLPLVLPPVVTGYYLLLLIGRNGVLGQLTRALFDREPQLVFTWQAAVLAAFAVSMPLTVRTARAAIEGVEPQMIEASHLLGRSRLATALLVTLPLASRGIVAGLVLSFARALGEFGATIMVAGNIPGRTNTMALEIYNAVIFADWASASVLVAIFTAVSAGFLLAAGRLGQEVRR